MSDELREKVARAIAFAGRDENDLSKDAEDFWNHCGPARKAKSCKQADAVIASMPTGVKVKPLGWSGLSVSDSFTAETSMGQYVVEHHPGDGWGMWTPSEGEMDEARSFHSTEDEAKTKAQDHFESLVLPALQLAPMSVAEAARVDDLVVAVSRLNLRKLVAGWNGEGTDCHYDPHPQNLGVTLKTTAGTVYEIDAALRALASSEGE